MKHCKFLQLITLVLSAFVTFGAIAVPNAQAEQQIIYFPLDADPCWTTAGEWEFGVPLGLGGANGYPDPNSGATGANVYGVNLAGDYSTAVGGPYYLTAGPLDLSDYANIMLRFQRWLNTDYPPYAYANIEVSNNGTDWVEVWNNDGTTDITDDQWKLVGYDISSVADNQSTVYIRWGYQIGSGAWAYSGWNIDDISLSGTPLDDLAVTPGDGMSSSGYRGGPFYPSVKNYTLWNTTATAIDWTAAEVNDVPWLDVSPSSGTLPPGGNTVVSVSLNADANSLAFGNYNAAVKVTNLTSGIEHIRPVSLKVDVLAFPSAEGEGRWSAGGRGGVIYEVTNLNNSGPGSLREAVEASGPRTVVFRVSGTIALQSKLQIDNPYITIAGQTAPGDGICLKNYNLTVAADHVIIRYMRFRLGDNAFQEADSVTIYKGHNIILDHCSASWSVDETLSSDCSGDPCTTGHYAGDLTIQWCIISESLNCSIHEKGCHGYASLLRGGYNHKYSFHHNLYAHHRGRSPRPGNYNSYIDDPCGLMLDFRNNVVYNWGGSYAGYNEDTSTVTRMNFVGNYYIEGNDSSGDDAFRENCKYSRAYFNNNWMNGVCPPDPWSLVQFKGIWTSGQLAAYKLSEPLPIESVITDDGPTAYALVLADAGASFPVRDAVDERIVNDVNNLTGSIIDDEDEVGGWPTLNSLPAPNDTDHDGMPDEWELAVCLDPNDANDRNDDRDSDGYTNVEEYLNWLPTSAPIPASTDINCDAIVDFKDFSEFANHWPASLGSPDYIAMCDFNHDDEISTKDLFYIAQDWLTEGQEY